MTENNNEIDLEKTTEEIQIQSQAFRKVRQEIKKKIIGQEEFIEKLLLGLISGGHMLVEGVPGLAKTETIKSLAECTGIDSQRIQFTPDLLPADLVGTQIYNPNNGHGNFETKKGPLFSNLILADEINRAPAKVQSALLEAMAEKTITLGEETFKLEEPFIVLATQNPLEQEGTYALPEAQMDRFMMKLLISYPTREEEKQIMNMKSTKEKVYLDQIINKEDIFNARALVDKVYVDEKIQDYIIDIVFATRLEEESNFSKKQKIKELNYLIDYGASPRASIALTLAAKTYAYLKGRAYVIPQDIKSIGFDVLRHRIGLSFEAEAEDKTADDIIKIIFDCIEVP
ncbi:MAG: MoxR family ATPase [Candidatus Caenarcaniphilales bacterium]|nr:MoxR family ATPase [Candidatus Caenarcaniphilales bacterium]